MIERNSGRPIGEDYFLQKEVDIYGKIFPIGTEYWKINSDWWYPLVDGAILPAYAVHFTVIKNNPSFFKPSEKIHQRPPLGVTPFWLHKELRYKELATGIVEYTAAGIEIPQEWVCELQTLHLQIKTRDL